MTVVQKYKSEIYVSGKDWHAGICFYSLVYLELEIFKDNSCKLTRKIYLDKIRTVFKENFLLQILNKSSKFGPSISNTIKLNPLKINLPYSDPNQYKLANSDKYYNDFSIFIS